MKISLPTLRKSWNPFVQTNEGLNIAILHITNLPLAASQSELTPVQGLFLKLAVPRALRALYGSQGAGSGESDSLKDEFDRRKRGGENLV